MISKQKNTRFRLMASLVLSLFAAIPAVSARREPPQEPQHKVRQSSARPAQVEHLGEVKFKQNCSRCHEAPQGFPSSITGTILRHMRVRASLSAEDEREILRFLNP